MGDDHDDDVPRFRPPHTKNQYDLNSKIMLTAIVSLSIVVVLVTVLHIYARCILRRQARRRAAIRQLGITISQIQSSEPPKTGLDPTVINALPIFVYKQSDQTGGDHEKGAVECAVCLSILEDDEMARVLPNCNHTFHAECIDRWFGSNSTCPICRTEAEPQLRPSTPEGGSGGVAPPSAPPLTPTVANMEGTSDGGTQSTKAVGSSSRLSSFRKMMLSKERVSSEGDSGGLVSPSAPPLNSGVGNMEGTSDGGTQSSKVGGSTSRLSSFRKMLSRERSSRRVQSCAEQEMEDIERQ